MQTAVDLSKTSADQRRACLVGGEEFDHSDTHTKLQEQGRQGHDILVADQAVTRGPNERSRPAPGAGQGKSLQTLRITLLYEI